MFVLLIFSCKKEEEANPYEVVVDGNKDTTATHTVPDPNSFAGLHQNIFAPTCANSGCHDGTFEPDFRTPESTYNTLVMRPVIKNDPAGTYTYRVVPGDYLNSVLYQRLMIDIDGQSGIMPLVLEPGSNWESKRLEYIGNVRTWIENGAKDIYGNAPVQNDLPPQLNGIFISQTGSTSPFPRNVQTGSIVIPTGTSAVDIWLSLGDDQTAADLLTYLKVKTSPTMNDFSTSTEIDLNLVTAHSEIGYAGNPVAFRHKFTLNLTGISPLQSWYIRAYVQDAAALPTEIPSEASAEYIKRFYSFQLGE